MYSKITNGIRVTVKPTYLADQSSPDEDNYIWAYHVTIENQGSDTIQLLSRYWKITDGNGITHEVEGEGVVGEQPLLTPGASYEYTSGAPLRTPGGIMVGAYRMEAANGNEFTVEIPAFSLDSPYESLVIH